MKVDINNYRNFYFGTGTEYYILSKFYMMGFEAYKLNPDIGYDLQVMNTAKNLYENKDRIEYNIQIKSSILIKEYTEFWISDKDFSMILNDEKGILLCSLYEPIMKADPNSFYYDRTGSDEWDKRLEEGGMRTFIQNYHKYNIEDKDHIFKFIDFKIKYFWLNRMHLRRLFEEKFIGETEKDGINYKVIKIKVDISKDAIRVLENDRKCTEDKMYFEKFLVDEVKSIYYLMNNCKSKYDLQEGKLFECDNPRYN
ncbi:hypothetical protein [Clostridium sp. YIM B02555]|uniref:hypothetical protein n=1 Tax=Clostridium sp. YIM B02555 TaxID=2911968 RepID=UPI001EED3BBE|nr:hypothetical protein [Clostridium sp. YIM B02555]